MDANQAGQGVDTVMSDAAPPATDPPPPPSQTVVAPGMENITATLSHGGRFIQYNIFGNIFEVTAKYKPPIMPIGKGAYGIVCSSLNSETNEQVAIKKIANAFDNKIDAKRTLREIKLLRHMDHENIVAIRDIIPPPRRELFNDVYIAYELMDTDLHQIIRSNQGLSEEHCQILRGLKYIHSANVLHRDLKPSNLLLNANCDLKICDFGLARVTSETDFMTEYVVTRWYRAPELLLNSSEYTAAIDVWSVGCIFMELMDRKPLFPGRDHVHQLRLLMELIGTPNEDDLGFVNENARRYIRQLPRHARQSFTEKFSHVHPAAIDLVERMLTFDPRQRITEEEVKEVVFGAEGDKAPRPYAFWLSVILCEKEGNLHGVKLKGILLSIDDTWKRFLLNEAKENGHGGHRGIGGFSGMETTIKVGVYGEKMLFLVEEGDTKASVEDALAHPYLASLHDISDEPICSMPFSFDFEQHALTEEQMKELVYREALAFNPEYQT
ncbi:hypothetical protein QJS10_CPA03g00750 [Acorus calamus]|uniref:Mitogen-activated protein kinase n=1 Tax=Acorus calamus TaxID=4465 RepID=A0AAV9F9V7_ACOCL|nr:hypothetical protein QJS10_CPA03g00750 [Acorus calamus]